MFHVKPSRCSSGPTAGHGGHLSESTRFVRVATIDAGRGTTASHTRGTRLATPTIETRVKRLERRAESDDESIHSILRILERMDRRFTLVEADLATLKADVATLKTDMDTVKADIATLTTVTDVLALKVASIETTTADTNKRVRVRGFEE